MIVNYPVGDFVIAVKNAVIAKKHNMTIRPTKLIVEVAQTLKRMGYLSEVQTQTGKLVVAITFKDKQPLMTGAKLISKPGVRIYWSFDELSSKRGPSNYILSTPKGVLSDREAIKLNSGGEVIAEII